jgi:hypothetical protein
MFAFYIHMYNSLLVARGALKYHRPSPKERPQSTMGFLSSACVIFSYQNHIRCDHQVNLWAGYLCLLFPLLLHIYI